jgi:hypothetical protein
MPLYSWFTQPGSSVPLEKNRFSSYYLYDTGTKKFCRIRLALGRDNPESSTENTTNIGYHSDHAVGFSASSNRLYSPGSGGSWSVNDKFELCYFDKPLQGPPPPSGYRTYNATVVPGSTKPSDFHRGSVVTADPKLPPDIKPKYLALLANDAIVNKTEYLKLTDGGASDVELAKAIQGQVVSVLKVKSFDEVTDQLILNKLTEQIKSICGDATTSARGNLDKALEEVRSANTLISEQLQSGTVPNKQLETACGDLQLALTGAETASSAGNVQDALAQVSKAQQAVRTALTSLGDGQESMATPLGKASLSLSQAEQGARGWQAVETEYKPLAEAGTVDDYMKVLSGGVFT